MTALRPMPQDAGTEDIRIAGALFDVIATRTADVEGVSRPAFSEVETRTLAMLVDFARDQGFDAWYDAGGNANFCLPGHRDADRFTVVGSHVDSVPFGGNFDGLAGVVAGLICLVRASGDETSKIKPLHVLAMRGEESAWFGPCYIGSKALTGRLAASELAARHKGDGRSLDEHMADIGIPMNEVRGGKPLIDLSRKLRVDPEKNKFCLLATPPLSISLGTQPTQSQRQLSMIRTVSRMVSERSITAKERLNSSSGAAEPLTVAQPVAPLPVKPVLTSCAALPLYLIRPFCASAVTESGRGLLLLSVMNDALPV